MKELVAHSLENWELQEKKIIHGQMDTRMINQLGKRFRYVSNPRGIFLASAWSVVFGITGGALLANAFGRASGKGTNSVPVGGLGAGAMLLSLQFGSWARRLFSNSRKATLFGVVSGSNVKEALSPEQIEHNRQVYENVRMILQRMRAENVVRLADLNRKPPDVREKKVATPL
jgi:hypothetical protein